MQIDVDFDVYKALTLLRRSEEDSHSDVLRRLMTLSDELPAGSDLEDQVKAKPDNILLLLRHENKGAASGAWIGNVFFPNGTQFRATYKGRTFHAEIEDQIWLDENGITRQSPSEAAGAISGTKVNGWRFWYAKRPMDNEWRRLDELRP